MIYLNLERSEILENIQGGIVDKNNNISTIFEEIDSLREMKTSLSFNMATLALNPGRNSSDYHYNDRLITEMTILKKLGRCNNIIKFIGVVKLNIGFISIYEWAEDGNLKDYYELQGKEFNWNDKLRISLDICRGLCFLQNANISHQRLEAKLTGFQRNCAYILQFEKRNDKGQDEIRWSAQEYLVNKNWNVKSEVF
ncbi:3527_t:CDS:2, partial [Funneliformis caledonium]